LAVDNYNSNINVNVNTGRSLAELRRLQAALSEFNQSVVRGNRNAAISQEAINSRLIQQINAIKGLSAAQARITGTTETFTAALERNKLTLREYARYSAAGLLEGGLGKALSKRVGLIRNSFAQERTILRRAYEDRVKLLQSQWIRLTKPGVAGGTEGLRITPTTLKSMDDFATKTQLAAQRMQILNATMKQGATQLINWGKNTQWAGRQLMVGLTMPIIMLGVASARVFREMEMATVRFRRVYGDLFTSDAETDAAISNIMRIGQEFAKLGIPIKDTMEMAADAAAAGFSGKQLEAQVTQANKLAVLGQIEQQQALETTISLQNALQISTEDLASSIDFLNAVENQTVVSLDDITTAIPKVAPIIKQLGGDVKDLAFFMTAMKEGGINAAQGANALKSGLASLINPSDKASEMLAGFGINIRGIVEANAGNLRSIVIGFAQALDTLDPLNRARAIEQLFGKFQFARLSTLFQNVIKDGTQASRVLDLMSASTEELAILSERELGKMEEAIGVKFTKTLEDVKLQLLPLGKLFLESMLPVLKFVGRIIENFNELGDGTKRFILTFAIGFPAVLMGLGLFGNLLGNTIKAVWGFTMMMRKATGASTVLGSTFNYMTTAELENVSMTAAMNTGHTKLIEVFNIEATAARQLAIAYNQASAAATRLAAANPGFFVGGKAGAVGATSKLPKKFNRGTKNVKYYAKGTDTVPAMLTPGEAVIPAESAQDPANKPLIQAMIAGKTAQSFGVGDSEVKSQSAGLSAAAKSRNVAARSYMILSPEQEAAKEKKSQAAKRGWETRRLNAIKNETAMIQQSADDKRKTQQAERKAKVGRIAGGISAGLGVASMGAFATGNTGLGMGLMGASFLASFAPLLMNPYVAAGAAVLAFAGIIYAGNKIMAERARKEEQFIRSITATTEQMKKVSEITGKVGASELMATRRTSGVLGQYNEAGRVGRQFGSQFLSSDIGKQTNTAFMKNKDLYGTEKAAKDFALQLGAYISDGVMTAEQARSVAEQISVNLGDAGLYARITGELTMLVGPNGEDLLRDPLQARVNLILESGKKARELLKETDVVGGGRKAPAQLAGLAGTSAEFAQAQLDAFTIHYEKQIKAKKDQLAMTKDKEEQLGIQQEINMLISQQIAGEKTLTAEVAKSLKISLKQFKEIQNTTTRSGFGGDAEEDAYFDALKGKVKDIFKGTDFETSANKLLETLSKISDENIFAQDEFKKAGFESAEAAQDFEVEMQLLLANKLANPDQIESIIRMFGGTEGGNLGTLSAALNLSIKTQGAAKTFELQSFLAGIGSGKKAKGIAQDIFLKVTALPTEQFDQTSKAIAVISELNGTEVNMRVMLEGLGEDGLLQFSRDLAAIEEIDFSKDPKEISVALKTAGFPEGGVNTIIENWEYYKKLAPEVRKEAIQKYLTFYQFRTNFQDPEAKEEWIRRYANKKAMEASQGKKYKEVYELVYSFSAEGAKGKTDDELTQLEVETYFGDPATTDVVPPGGGDGTGKDRAGRDTALDDLLKRLKMVRDAAINAEGGVKELLRITQGKGINKFSGVLQQLQEGVTAKDKKGKVIGKDIQANRGFLDFVSGLDKKTMAQFVTVTKKGKAVLTEFGKAANEAFAELPIGEFQESQKRTVEGAIAQRQAFLKLRAAGVDYAQALKMIEDEAFAVALINKDIKPNELRAMADEAARAAKEVQILNMALRQTSQETRNKTTQLQTTLKALQGATGGELQRVLGEGLGSAVGEFTKEQLALIASDPGLAQGISDLLSGAVPEEEIANKIKDIFDALDGTTINANLQLDIDMAVDPISAVKKQIDEIGSMMNKYFQLRRMQIERQFRSEKRAAEEAVSAAEERVRVEQEVVEEIQNRIDVIQLEIDKTKLAIDLKYDIPLKTAQDAAEKLSRNIETDLSREIERLQELSDDLSRSIELEFTRPIEALQSEIDTLSRSIETNFERPIAALQEESSDLSNELELMDKVIESINEKYDKQEEALQSISDINQDIANQEKDRISLADALSQGDISAAAQLAQQMRNEAAQKAASSQSDKLRVARENELSRVLARNGMTRKQIEDRQFAIGQQIFNLEEQRELVDIRVVALQDRIYNIEQARAVKNIEINALADQIYNLGEQREAQQLRLKAIEDTIYNLEKARKVELDAIEIKERAILQIRYNELIPAQALLDLENNKLKIARLALEEVEARVKAALEGLQAEEDAWNDVELAILEAELAMWDFNAALEEAIRLAQQLAALMASLGSGGGGGGSFGTASYKTGTQYGDVVGQESAIERVQEAIGYNPEEGYDGQFTKVENKIALKGIVENQKNLTDQMILDYFTSTDEAVNAALDSTREYMSDVIKNVAEGVATNSEVLDYANVVGRLTGQRVALASGGSVKDKVKYMMGGGNIMPKYMNDGGMFKAINTDTVPAMLSPGEFVMSKYAVKNFGVDNMKAVNDGTYSGESVYNYSINVNVKSGANPDEIARSVMTQIKQIDSQRIRGQRVS
jgi:TP901 family phage tail tape measure protein